MAVRAPVLPDTVEWLNVARPLTTTELRGRVLVLDFWTSACINCQHTLPTLAAIERELAGEPFLVLGVHSPKFSAQREAALVREAVQALEVTHPVLLDNDAAITRSFAVTGWPTLIVVDPRGYLVATLRGEPEPVGLLRALRMLLEQTRAEGTLGGGPLPLLPAPPGTHQVSFPGALATEPDGGFFVADQGHNQVVVCHADGTERSRIGAGLPGLADGPAGAALLHRPCGLAFAPEPSAPTGGHHGTLYVADTGNHAVRAVDLAAGTVVTVSTLVRSPWGLAWDGRRLFIAEAGQHRIQVYDPATGVTAPFAGTGVEGCRDGAAAQAWFAQPSGLALLGGSLFVVDAETSTIRAIEDLDGTPVVRTVCGSGELFGFGDQDGTGRGALLQHPIGLAAGDGQLVVADTYNHKLRSVDPATGACRTLFGGGAELETDVPPGRLLAPARPGAPAFSGPEGLAWRPGELLVADTGNHRILAVSLPAGARRTLLSGPGSASIAG